MKHKIIAGGAAVLLALGVSAFAAFPAAADDAPAPDDTAPVAAVVEPESTAPVDEAVPEEVPAIPEAVAVVADNARHYEPPQLVTEWYTWQAPSWAPNATDANSVGWPQTLVGQGQLMPTQCEVTYQQDRYTGTREQIDAIIADQKLTGNPPEDSAIVQEWHFVSSEACPVPTVTQCESDSTGPVSTNLDAAGWTFGETRSKGHNVYVEGGLHVYTDSNDSESKAAGYHALAIPLGQVGTPSIDLSDTSGVLPSIQLGIDRDGNGTWDGYLVNEGDIYGHGNWWTNKTGFGVPAGGGYPSLGTLDAYLAANPNAQVVSFGYSLGSGVNGSSVIHSITVGCVTYSFDWQPTPVTAQFSVEPTAPTCTESGSFDTTLFPIDREGYTLSVDRPFDGPGVYTVTATAKDGFAIQGDVSRQITVGDKLGYQHSDNEAACYTPPLQQCEADTTLDKATDVDPRGWGDLFNATWVKDGIQLTATDSDEAYAYVDAPDFESFKLSQIGDISADATGDFAFILQTADGNPWNIHRESDGTWWTATPGLFVNGNAGYYWANDLSEIQADPYITEIAIWVNPGHEALVSSISFDCLTQPFGAVPTSTTPPTDTPTETPVPVVANVPAAPTGLASTGYDLAPVVWFTAGSAVFAGAFLLIGITIYRRRATQR